MASNLAASRNRAALVDPSSAPPQQPPPHPVFSPESWTGIILSLLFQLRTRRSWAVSMIITGTLDMIVNLVNLVQMSSDDLNYGLVIGPTTREHWICLCFFTIVGTLFYFPETANTVSALYSADGDTFVPFHYELVVTLLFEHIPLSVVDYLIIRSRRKFTTTVQAICAGIRLVFIIIRLLWYAHIEGKKLRKNDKYELHQFFIMLCYILFSVAVAFPVNNFLKNTSIGVMKPAELKPVSIFMLQRDGPPERKFELDITDILKEQGWNYTHYTLVHSALTIQDKAGKPVDAYYECFNGGQKKPYECQRNGARFLLFNFVYQANKGIGSLGEIAYNYAEFCLNRTFLNSSDSFESRKASSSPFYPWCFEPKEPLADGWRLFYFKSVRQKVNETWSVRVSQPFEQGKTSAMPRYDPQIPVCVKGIRRYCEAPTGKAGTRNSG